MQKDKSWPIWVDGELLITWQSCKWQMAWQWAVVPSFLWPSYFALLHGQMEVRYYCWPVRAITRQRRQVTVWRLPLYHHRSCFTRHNQHHSRRPRTSLGEISAEWPPLIKLHLDRRLRWHCCVNLTQQFAVCQSILTALYSSGATVWFAAVCTARKAFFSTVLLFFENSPECEVYCLDHVN